MSEVEPYTATRLSNGRPEATPAQFSPNFNPQQNEDFFMQPTKENYRFYDPATCGEINQTGIKEILGGKIYTGTYSTPRAKHKFGLYLPDDFKADSNQACVVMTGALGTGVQGHNQEVASEMMRSGFPVIMKGPPHTWHSNRFNTLSLTEDANELMGLFQKVKVTGKLGDLNKLWIYGESQAAMKGLALPGLAEYYDYEISGGLLVAICYIDRIDLKKPWMHLKHLAGMAMSGRKFLKDSSLDDKFAMLKTIQIKDMRSHTFALPKLLSGEAGTFIDRIPKGQKLNVLLFSDDGHSNPERVKQSLIDHTSIVVDIEKGRGHIDGILGLGTLSLRNVLLLEERQRNSQGNVAA